MYISSKIACKELASRNRIDGDKEYKVDCLIEDYFKPLMYTNDLSSSLNDRVFYELNISCNMFKHLLNCDDELRRDGGTDCHRVEWYENHIRKQLMKLDDITLTFLINALILIEEHVYNIKVK